MFDFLNFIPPENLYEAIFIAVPVITLIIGLGFLVMPKRMLAVCGLEAKETNPEAIGEGRASWAGIMLAMALGCLLLQEPKALQPGLSLSLGLAWVIATFGFFLQGIFDGSHNRNLVIRMAGSAFLACLGLWSSEYIEPGFVWPVRIQDWVLFLIALLTFVLGLISLFLPAIALKILRLKPKDNVKIASGESRNLLAGFNMALGGSYLIFPQAFVFLGLILSLAWFLTGLGRLLSVVFDRGFTVYNVAGVVYELVLGTLGFAVIFGII